MPCTHRAVGPLPVIVLAIVGALTLAACGAHLLAGLLADLGFEPAAGRTGA